MIANRNYEHNEPITWIGRVPVYLATILAGVQAVSMILTSLAMAAGGASPSGSSLLGPLIFNFQSAVGDFAFWQFVTYALVNPPDFFFVFQLFIFAWFGAEVEKFLGRRSFAWLCILLLLATPVLLSALGLFGIHAPFAGAGSINLAVFITFAMIYPRAEIFLGIEARWIAIALAAVNSLIFLAHNSWVQLAALWWSLGVAALWLRLEGAGGFKLPDVGAMVRQRHSEKKLHVVRQEKPKAPEPGVHDSIDPILEKIARQGIGSLSRGEREKLERARAALLEKERGN